MLVIHLHSNSMYSSAKKLHRVLSSGEIRKTFLDYFIVNHDHKFIRSSPVVPFCDPTVAFVNAGMNQFKSVFLGKSKPAYPRVANSQKCIRVGGKHNDLSIVGQDGYHHTFFEMLGNWSFGDYFKREACVMALELLRGPYNIDPNRLYVTYFGGDQALGLPADEECREIWHSLGLPEERILPFGAKDNFWEMGTTGPCGPCTEIHIDHRPDLAGTNGRNRLVNAGTPELTELWNLVFIQYNRNEDGSIAKLASHHVDTGMGFERLTAILQNKISNYDTDLFTPIFDGIQKISKVPAYSGTFPSPMRTATLDTGYRIVADHARMVTACLADGMLPDQNQKLRRILRKAFSTAETVFNCEDLIMKVIPIVVETLGSAYPEMEAKQSAVLELIEHEREVFKALRQTSSRAFAEMLSEFPNLEEIDLMECPGFVSAYREFQANKPTFTCNIIPGRFLYKLTDTYGLSEDNFLKLAELESMECDLQGYREELEKAKLRSKNNCRIQSDQHQIEEDLLRDFTRQLSATDDTYKYNYSYDNSEKVYIIPSLTAMVTGLLHNGRIVSEIDVTTMSTLDATEPIYIVTDKTNFYHESGGQQSDCGKLILPPMRGKRYSVQLSILNVLQLNNCIIHVCAWPQTEQGPFVIRVGQTIDLHVDPDHRRSNMCHHTATHLLNGALRTLFQKVTYQVSSAVTSECCKLEVGLIGKRITKEDVQLIEDLIGRVICAATPVRVTNVSAADVLRQDDITMIPGEIYPETDLRLITIECGEPLQFTSKELCCGTHVANTQELQHFCITNLKQTNRARYAFTAVAGTAAANVLKTAALIRHRVDMLEEQYRTDKLTNATESELLTIRNNMIHRNDVLPYAFKMDTLQRINEIVRRVRDSARTTLKEFVEVEMRNMLQEKSISTHPYILHYISSSALVEEVPLQKATKLCNDRPILVIGMCDGILKARCCVPKAYVSKEFSAEKWLKVFAATFRAQVAAPKDQNPDLVCNMRGKKVSTMFDEQLEEAMAAANRYAEAHVQPPRPRS